MAVPYTFGTATSSIPLSQLDSNFNTVITLGNTAIQLGNTVTTLNNMTLANVTISSGNVTITNVAITTANVTTANITTAVIGTETVTTSTITTANVTTANITTDNITNGTVITSLTLSYGTANGVAYLNGSKVLTTGSALTFDGTNVGLGTTSPNSPVGSTQVTLHINNSTAGTSPGIHLTNGDTGTTAGDGTLIFVGNAAGTGTTSLNLYNQESSPICFFTATTERMRIDSSGNVGIGTTSTSDAKVSIGGTVGLITTASRVLQVVDSAGGALFLGSSSSSYSYLIHNTSSSTSQWLYRGGVGVTLDSSGNLGLGVTPSAFTTGKSFEVGNVGNAFWGVGQTSNYVLQNLYYNGGVFKYASSNPVSAYAQNSGYHYWYNAASGTVGTTATLTQAMTLDASGNLLVGTTSVADLAMISVVAPASRRGISAKTVTSAYGVLELWNADTTGNNAFVDFYTDAGQSVRGSITYNRAGGLTVYNTTSDYRAKDIYGPIVDSGKLIDSTPVYMGKMKGATQERPMFIAHETPDYAHTGEKDAVDANGNPVYQQMDASALVPVMWAEIQSLRKRLTALEST